MMDTSSEDLDESMLDVIQRAEAFISAHSFLNREAERSSSNIFDASGDSSFRTADGESSAADTSSGLNTSSGGPSTSGMNHSGEPTDRSNITEEEHSSGEPEVPVEVLSDDSQATLPYDINEQPQEQPLSVDNDDCIVIEEPHQIVDLCSPYVESVSPRSRRARRRRADAAPVVESISLDDTVADAPPPAISASLPSSPPKKRKTAVATFQTAPSQPQSESFGGAAVPSISVTCPICLESIFHQQAASTVCGHLFCKQCISQEIQIRKKCPMCKRALKRHQVHPIYFN